MYFNIPITGWVSVVSKSHDIHIIYIYLNKYCYCKLLGGDWSCFNVYMDQGLIRLVEWGSGVAVERCATFISSMVYLRCTKLYFRKKGAWVSYRRTWPRLLTAKFGYGHPFRVGGLVWYIKRFKRYVQFSNLLFMHFDPKVLQFFIQKFKTIRTFSPYIGRGLTLARRVFIKKRGKESQYTKLKSKVY